MNNRLTIQDIAGLMAERTGKDKSLVELFLKEFIAQVREGVYSDKIAKVKGVGTFKIIPVDPRESIHVNTGERFLIPAHYKFSFLPDKELRDLVNKPFSFFETTELNENVGFSDLDESEDKEADAEDESVEEVMPDEQPIQPEETPTGPVPAANPIEEKPAETSPEEEPDAAIDETPADEIIASETTASETTASEMATCETTTCPTTPDEPVADATADDEITAGHPDREPTDLSAGNEAENKNNGVTFRQNVILTFAVLMCCIGIAYLYANRHFIRTVLFGVEVVYPDPPLSAADPLPLPEIPASPAAAATDTTLSATPADTIPTPAPQVSRPVSPKILATVKIEPGNRLTLISLKYYGSKIFWVYLYEYNKARIKDPNNIPVGTRIEVPAPETYGIDVRNKASVRKASVLQTEILAREK